ncbi:Probable para-aminobenzoate synthase component I [Mycobacteroides abscessus]|nr:Probable para-aminobenzoate synthase component I [Mycobacteroides abscessus]
MYAVPWHADRESAGLFRRCRHSDSTSPRRLPHRHLGRRRLAISRIVLAAQRHRCVLQPHQGHPGGDGRPCRAADVDQGRRRERDDHRSGAQRPGTHRRYRHGHRPGAAGRPSGARRVASGVHRGGQGARRGHRRRSARSRIPARFGDRHSENPCTPTTSTMGSRAPRGVLRHHRHALTRGRPGTQRRDPHRRNRAGRQRRAGRGRRHHRRLRRRPEWQECLHKAAATIGLTAIAELNPAL